MYNSPTKRNLTQNYTNLNKNNSLNIINAGKVTSDFQNLQFQVKISTNGFTQQGNG